MGLLLVIKSVRFRLESIVFKLVVLIDPISSNKHAVWIKVIEGALSTNVVWTNRNILESNAFVLIPLPKHKNPIWLSSKSKHKWLFVLLRKRNRHKLLWLDICACQRLPFLSLIVLIVKSIHCADGSIWFLSDCEELALLADRDCCDAFSALDARDEQLSVRV